MTKPRYLRSYAEIDNTHYTWDKEQVSCSRDFDPQEVYAIRRGLLMEYHTNKNPKVGASVTLEYQDFAYRAFRLCGVRKIKTEE